MTNLLYKIITPSMDDTPDGEHYRVIGEFNRFDYYYPTIFLRTMSDTQPNYLHTEHITIDSKETLDNLIDFLQHVRKKLYEE